MKKILLILMVFLIPLVCAQEDFNDTTSKEFCNFLQNEVNFEKITIPKFLPYGNEKMNIYVSKDEGIGSIITENKKVISISCDILEEPTYNIYIKNFDILEEIGEADSPVDELNAKLSNKDIVIEGATATKKMKGLFTRIAIKIASWFV